ncbi:MAG: hypothetical protein IIX91_03645 [Clostridia bacterium]|nr:hypothetical protein [Clostridia bacterium]
MKRYAVSYFLRFRIKTIPTPKTINATEQITTMTVLPEASFSGSVIAELPELSVSGSVISVLSDDASEDSPETPSLSSGVVSSEKTGGI